MAWSYMVICLFDFVIAPTGVAFLITFYKSSIPVWSSLTLSNGGVMHLAFGAILGVSAWGRTQESVTNTRFGPGGFGGDTTIISRQSDVVVPTKRSPNAQPRADDDDSDIVIPPPRRPPVID